MRTNDPFFMKWSTLLRQLLPENCIQRNTFAPRVFTPESFILPFFKKRYFYTTIELKINKQMNSQIRSTCCSDKSNFQPISSDTATFVNFSSLSARIPWSALYQVCGTAHALKKNHQERRALSIWVRAWVRTHALLCKSTAIDTSITVADPRISAARWERAVLLWKQLLRCKRDAAVALAVLNSQRVSRYRNRCPISKSVSFARTSLFTRDLWAFLSAYLS